ncbi:MAG: spore cortex biosynthesis protein YabQ, partial [Bacillota bacterium]|nr:spore cortex biosynthesis protein YabQ [Bacillota bacterium]
MLQEQAFNIAQIALLGVALGVLIDMYRIIASMLNPGKYLAGLFDLLFWLSCTLWAFVYLLGVNSGEARLYVLALLLLGFVLEQKILGRALRTNLRSVLRTLVKGLSKLINAVSIFLEAVLNAITAPYRFIARIVLWPIIWLVGLVLRPIRFMVRR